MKSSTIALVRARFCDVRFSIGPALGAKESTRSSCGSNGAPVFKVDPFWPKPLPNRWSMQQVTGLSVEDKTATSGS